MYKNTKAQSWHRAGDKVVLRQEKGLSLIEVLISLAIGGIVMMSSLQLFKMQSDSNSFILGQSLANQLLWETTILFRNKQICDHNVSILVDKNFSTDNPEDIIQLAKIERVAGQSLVSVGVPTADGVLAEQISLRNFRATAMPSVYMADLVLNTKISKSNLNENFVRKFPLALNVTVAGNTATIQSCNDGTSQTSITARLGAPEFPDYIICQGEVYMVRRCDPPNECLYKITGPDKDIARAQYNRINANTANRTQAAEGGGKCPGSISLNGERIQGN